MTELDSVLTEGLDLLDEVGGETFRLRGVDRQANVGEVQIARDFPGGGQRAIRTLTILYSRSNGEFSPPLLVGETVLARGLTFKIATVLSDATSHTIACTDEQI